MFLSGVKGINKQERKEALLEKSMDTCVRHGGRRNDGQATQMGYTGGDESAWSMVGTREGALRGTAVACRMNFSHLRRHGLLHPAKMAKEARATAEGWRRGMGRSKKKQRG
eukprot:746693-Hanusia_phi.AAC.3